MAREGFIVDFRKSSWVNQGKILRDCFVTFSVTSCLPVVKQSQLVTMWRSYLVLNHAIILIQKIDIGGKWKKRNIGYTREDVFENNTHPFKKKKRSRIDQKRCV